MKFTLVPLTVLVLTSPTTVHGSERPIVATPNIVVIVADDLGWGHVGWRNPTVKTPNLDRLAVKGIKLNPSRPTAAVPKISAANREAGRRTFRGS